MAMLMATDAIQRTMRRVWRASHSVGGLGLVAEAECRSSGPIRIILTHACGGMVNLSTYGIGRVSSVFWQASARGEEEEEKTKSKLGVGLTQTRLNAA